MLPRSDKVRLKGDAMPNPIEKELGIDSTMHRFRRWMRNQIGVVGKSAGPQDQRQLDPLTANYAAWNAVRHGTREWPHYKEAPNSVEIYVSPEDWEDYWCIDAGRKEESIAAYVRARAAEKGYWMAGDPQVVILQDDAIGIGDIDVVCQFVEPADERERPGQMGTTTEFEPVPEEVESRKTTRISRPEPVDEPDSEEVAGREAADRAATMRFVDAKNPGEARLVDDNGFRLTIHSGDCIGAVRAGEDVPEEVNVRLDAAGFPYAAIKQCSLEVAGGSWNVVNHAPTGTMLVRADGARFMLHLPEPFPICEGDVLYIGPRRPLRFELSQW